MFCLCSSRSLWHRSLYHPQKSVSCALPGAGSRAPTFAFPLLSLAGGVCCMLSFACSTSFYCTLMIFFSCILISLLSINYSCFNQGLDWALWFCFSLCCLREGHTCCPVGTMAAGQMMLLAAEGGPVSFMHTKKSDTETRMCSTIRTACGFLTSCCDSGKCHQLVTKKKFHAMGQKNPSGLFWCCFKLHCCSFLLLPPTCSCTSLPAVCWFCLVAAVVPPGAWLARATAEPVLAAKLGLLVAELNGDWVEQV